MNDERLLQHTRDLDVLAELAAVDCGDFAPTHDVWFAMQLAAGRPRDEIDFCDYMAECRRAATLTAWEALTYFGAVDDDDAVPSYDEVES